MTQITIIMPTYNRYDNTLPISLMSIANQSRTPNRVILIDDSPQKRFYEYPIMKTILTLYKEKGIEFDYFHGQSKGMCPALQMGLDDIESGWVLKMDDDHILEYNAIELLENNISNNIGAISGIMIEDKKNFIKKPTQTNGIYNKIENIYTELGIQFIQNQSDEIKKVEHIYSLYFFKRELAENYPIELQPSGNREDTIFTHTIYRKGYDLIIDPKVKIYHLHTTKADALYDKSKLEWFFIDKLKEWEIVPNKLQFKDVNGTIVMTKDGKEYKIMV